MCTAQTGRTHGCSDQRCKVKILLASLEPSTHGPFLPISDVRSDGGFRVDSGLVVLAWSFVAIDPNPTSAAPFGNVTHVSFLAYQSIRFSGKNGVSQGERSDMQRRDFIACRRLGSVLDFWAVYIGSVHLAREILGATRAISARSLSVCWRSVAMRLGKISLLASHGHHRAKTCRGHSGTRRCHRRRTPEKVHGERLIGRRRGS